MAGRPAPGRTGGSGLLYGLIAFAILSVLFLALFIMQLTRVQAALDQVARAQSREKTNGSPPSYYATEAGNRRSTVFAVMDSEINELGRIITGHPDKVGPQTREYATKLVADLATRHSDLVRPNDSLAAALLRVSDALSKAEQATLDLTSKFDQAQAEVESLAAQQKTTREEFEGQAKSFGERLAEVEASRDKLLAEKDSQVEGLSASVDTATQELSTLKRDIQTAQRDSEFEQARLQKRLGDMQAQIRELKPSQFDRDAILKKADGRIMRAIPGSEVVYVNLGADDGAKVGLGLEVYSKTGELRDTVRGKASLEIVTVSDNVAECRVTRRTPGAPILEGDLVLNIAFERGRRPRFVLRGDFDLNYDGTIDPTGRETLEGLVRQWGGEPVEDLNESVDYLVVGTAPRIPVSPSGQLTDVVRDQQFQKELEAGKFAELVSTASQYSIPVITQNQFLFLTGYAGDTPISVRR